MYEAIIASFYKVDIMCYKEKSVKYRAASTFDICIHIYI